MAFRDELSLPAKRFLLDSPEVFFDIIKTTTRPDSRVANKTFERTEA